MVKSSLSTSLHIMTLLAMFPEKWISSKIMAESIHINSVLVRQELRKLKEAELIQSKEGKNGGVKLIKNASEILLADVFKAIKKDDHVFEIRSETPDKTCKVGKKINTKLNSLYQEIDNAILLKLEETTLETFKNSF
ncbi:RrF2 family transcriptional regulator [Tenacibaculum jejuense]|uniref:Putative transcriptional regulator n=1 Tax=Tenacibaculum jejuense TaxID=584609 RepID=A0A238U613_9FLAO|nr:Rrf2 family transcriptional regulator [Tenacibaculum jejuense]SNR14661.1 putative transcriptional regulator [Tenacibaculum jejuense]